MPFDPTNPGAPQLGSSSDPTGSYAPGLGEMPAVANQQQAQAAILAQAQQQTQQQQQAPPPKKKGGWGWNPFQDVGQVWHDVDTHGLGATFRLMNRAYVDVTRPLTTVVDVASKGAYMETEHQGELNPFSANTWSQAWGASQHQTLGQSVVMGMNNFLANSAGSINPDDPSQVNNWFVQNGVARWTSAGTDAFVGFKLDPSAVALTKASGYVKALKNAPITDTTDVSSVVASPRTQRFVNWAQDKTAAQIAQHPILSGSSAKYAVASYLEGASPAEASKLLSVAFGDKSALNDLAKVNEALAFRAANATAPLAVMERFALSPDDWATTLDWLKPMEKTKISAAQAALKLKQDQVQAAIDSFGLLKDRTASSFAAEKWADLKGNLQYRNTRDVDHVSFLHSSLFDTPVRIYQSLTDKPAMGLIQHSEDSAPDQVKAWLNKSSALDTGQKQAMVSRYAMASKADRPQVWDTLEKEAYEATGDKFGVPVDLIHNILNESKARSSSLAEAVKSRSFGALKGPSGEDWGVLPTATGEALAHPAFVTQLEGGAVPMSNLKFLETALQNAQKQGILATAAKSWDSGKDLLTNYLDRVMGIWKPLTLWTMHRAYNHNIDDYLRMAATLHGVGVSRFATEGTANFLRNRVESLTQSRWVQNMQAEHEMNISDAKASYSGLKSNYLAQQAALKAGEHIPDDLLIKTSDLRSSYETYTGLRDSTPEFIRPKHRLGEGSFKVPGTNVDVREAFGGPNGDWARGWTSSKHTWDSLINDGAERERARGYAMRTKQFATIRPQDDLRAHTAAYVHYVRNIMTPDPAAKMLLKGRSVDDVTNWLRDSPEGQAHMRSLNWGDPEALALTKAEMVKKYLPTNEMREAAAKGKFTAKTISNAMPDAASRPEVSGDVNLMVHGGHPATASFRRINDNIMRLTGSMPDDIMVRHPFFNGLYKQHITDLVRHWVGPDGSDAITADQLDMLTRQAMKLARNDLQKTVYDVSRFNDAGHTLRFISPFFNAWWSAMTSWSRLFMKNPQLLARTYEFKRDLWNAPFAIDTSTGQQADNNTSLDNLAFVFHAPKGLSGLLGGMTTIPFSAKTLLSPTYVDSVGNPGFGPVVAIPANQIAKESPTAAGSSVMQYITGGFLTADSMSQIIPSDVREMVGLSQLLHINGSSEDNSNYASLKWSIWQEQMYDYQSGLRSSPPNWSDIDKQAAIMTAVDYVANRLSPIGFKPAPAQQFLIDQYRNLQNQDPSNAQQDFYDKFGPQAMVFTQSLHSNPSGIPATIAGAKAYQKYGALLKQFPELGSAIIGPEGDGTFSDAAYQWEVANGVRPALTPEAAAKQAMTNLGWTQYGKILANINAQLQMRGLVSVNQKGAEDLKALKNAYVSATGDSTSSYYNPDFYSAYGSFDQNTYETRISALLQVAQDPTILANPLRGDMRAVQAYSQVRDATYAMLQQRSSKTLTANSNWDIAQWYDNQVGQLIMSNTNFADLYERYLSKDDFKEPV